jgi:hypothetical protein
VHGVSNTPGGINGEAVREIGREEVIGCVAGDVVLAHELRLVRGGPLVCQELSEALPGKRSYRCFHCVFLNAYHA